LRIEAEHGRPIAEFLHDIYVVQYLSTPEIYDRYGITYRMLRELLVMCGIPQRTRSEAARTFWTKDDGTRRAITIAGNKASWDRDNGARRRKMSILAKERMKDRDMTGQRNPAKKIAVRRKISAAKKVDNPGLMPMLLAHRQWRLDNPSGAELTMIAALDAAGLVYEREFQVGRYSLDFAFVACQVAIEVDGVGWHTRGRNAASDVTRDAWLAGQGWRIFRYTTHQVGRDAAACIQDVIAKLHVLGIDPPARK
jgi:very-short-patch-repair endonuclease